MWTTAQTKQKNAWVIFRGGTYILIFECTSIIQKQNCCPHKKSQHMFCTLLQKIWASFVRLVSPEYAHSSIRGWAQKVILIIYLRNASLGIQPKWFWPLAEDPVSSPSRHRLSFHYILQQYVQENSVHFIRACRMDQIVPCFFSVRKPLQQGLWLAVSYESYIPPWPILATAVSLENPLDFRFVFSAHSSIQTEHEEKRVEVNPLNRRLLPVVGHAKSFITAGVVVWMFHTKGPLGPHVSALVVPILRTKKYLF